MAFSHFRIEIVMESIPVLTHKELLEADHDYEMAASAANLLYVSDAKPGILRLKKGKGYCYLLAGKPVKDKTELQRIRGLAIPPSWTNVWICPAANGHIQATGLDLRRRKQYRYHPLWNSLRNETKFHRLYEFGKALPLLRERMEADMRTAELTREKVLATVLGLMERTYILVGNNEYEKTNGSYGLTTMKNKHVSITGDKLVFSFTGKKGVHHDITLRNKRLARTVSQCKDIPGRELFQYYGEDGTRRSIDSGMVNHYIKEAVSLDFTAKDFRTWAGTLHALQAFASIGEACTSTDCKKNVTAVLDIVSKQLGNTRTVCKKYYVHPGLIQLYEDNKLVKYLKEMENSPATPAEGPGLTAEEEVLMKILKQYIKTTPLHV
jgi:DNA topoisomerase-1